MCILICKPNRRESPGVRQGTQLLAELVTTWKFIQRSERPRSQVRELEVEGSAHHPPSSPSLTPKKAEVPDESKTWARQHPALDLEQKGQSPLLFVFAPEPKRRPGQERRRAMSGGGRAGSLAQLHAALGRCHISFPAF